MLKQTFLITIITLTMVYAITTIAQPLFQSSPYNNSSMRGSQTILSPSEFSSKANEMSKQNQNQYEQELNQKLAQIPKPSSKQTQAPLLMPSTPTESKGGSNLYYTPENNPTPNMQQQPTAPTTTAEMPLTQTAPATTNAQPAQPAPTQQPQIYTGFQTQGGGATTTTGQQPLPKQPQKGPASGGWNIKY